jgi:hypothetical protein
MFKEMTRPAAHDPQAPSPYSLPETETAHMARAKPGIATSFAISALMLRKFLQQGHGGSPAIRFI